VANLSAYLCRGSCAGPCARFCDLLHHARSLGSKGKLPGQFDRPIGLAISDAGNLLAVADCYNHRVQVFDLAALISTDDPFAQLERTRDAGKNA